MFCSPVGSTTSVELHWNCWLSALLSSRGSPACRATPGHVSFWGAGVGVSTTQSRGAGTGDGRAKQNSRPRGLLGGLPAEQAADWRQGAAALQGLPEARAAALPRARLGRRQLHPHRPLAAGLDSHGLQPGRPGAPRAGHLLFRLGLRLCQHGPHGCSLAPLHVPGQRGADLGLIKIRGDRCWRDLTCMDFHYETQPVPNPMAYVLHRSPWWFHRFETLSNHFLELVVPFFVFLGRSMCILHGALQILFQVVLIISGNLSFLNWLTIVPSLACFDDATLAFLFPSGPGGLKDRVLKMQEEEAQGPRAVQTYGCVARRLVNLAMGVLIAGLSVPVVLNLLSPRQIMNSSFHPLRIVNTYGAFGSITKERTEVILQGTASPNASAPDAEWKDYEFKCKPGDLRRRPCLISPYHYRLDWLMWFAAFQTYEHNEWIIHLAGKLLANDAQALSLLGVNPFEGTAPPRWVRGEHYRYKFSRPGGRHAAEGKWWIRKRLGPYFPPLRLQDLKGYFKSREWPEPEPK
uniref:Lipase maturation factor n=1 Tax=Sus scrofa TaxID=9823 RepID=A0A8D1T665_PIG